MGGLVCRADGAALPYRTTLAFARRAVALGARVLEGTRVDAVRRERGLFRLSTPRGTFEAPQLVNCAGAWAGAIAAQLGEPVPLQVIAPMLMITEPVAHFLDPVVGATGRTLSFKQFEYACADRRRPAWHRLARAQRDEARPVAAGRERADGGGAVPAHARRSGGARAWAGIEARMPDDIPVIGASGTSEGAWHAFGFSAHGFQLGPIVGSIMADLVTGRGTRFDLQPFAVGRFSNT